MAESEAKPETEAPATLIRAEGLVRLFGGGRTWYGVRRPVLRAIDGVSLTADRGRTLGIVGESGCGKSTLARMLVGLLEPSTGWITLNGQPVRGHTGAARKRFFRSVQMVFQDPLSSLNPRKTVRQILEGPLQALLDLNREARRTRVAELMDLVGLRAEFTDRYPHEFSGGQAQRIGIARALAVEPQLLVLDEPVSALDVSIQAQILKLLRDLQDRLGLTYVFISHDLAVVEALCDRVMVMQRGRVVEHGTRADIFGRPRNAYTRTLLSAVPVPATDPTPTDHAAPAGGFGLPRIDLDRLKADMTAIGAIGRAETDPPSYNRPSYSDADMQARRLFRDMCAAEGLEAWIDSVGNVLARWDPANDPPGADSGTGGGDAALCLGSHLDTVPNGGFFDGVLGVCAGLEIVRTLKDAGMAPRFPILLVATAEEEGRFGGMLGSQALCGSVGQDWFDNATDDSGVKLVDAMRRQGLAPERLSAAALAPQALRAYLELHIEQGPVLEAEATPIGIVTGISGVFNWTVTLTGHTNHAGTTPMALRRDAFMGLAAVAQAIPTIIQSHGTEETRITIGRIEISPGFVHTVPGKAVFSLIGRDTDEAVMRAVAAALQTEIARAAYLHRLEAEVREESWLSPTQLDTGLASRLVALSTEAGNQTRTMASGAGHDAQSFAAVTRAGLIFVPSRNGISHAPEEATGWGDIERGVDLLLRAVMDLASAADDGA